MDQNLQNVATPLDEAARQFVLWSLAALGIPLERCNESAYSIEVPGSHQRALGGERLTFSFDHPEVDAGTVAHERLSFESPLFRWLVDQLQAKGPLVNAAPAEQPASVHQLAQKIFSVYSVEGGTVHLGGCTLDDRPFLRLTRLRKSNTATAADQLGHSFYDSNGSLVEPPVVRSLGLEQLAAYQGTSRLSAARLREWLAAVEARESVEAEDAAGEWLVTTVVWCKYAEGKITFTIGDAAAEHTFTGCVHATCGGHTAAASVPLPRNRPGLLSRGRNG